MPRLGPWLIALIAFFAVFIDIPKHQFSFPFNCPGICSRLGDNSYNQEIKTHLGLDLQGGTQLILRLRTEEIPAGGNVVDYNDRARRVIDRRINGLGVSEPVIQALRDDKILLELPGIDDIPQAHEIAAPRVNTVFTSGRGIIEGNFTTQSAKELSLLINSGALPVSLDVVQSSRVEPTLGQDSVKRSLLAGAIGLLLVAFFMVVYYRLPGAIAVIALFYYTALTYALFRLVPVTLTLAGVAGFILSIGMAVDANVLTFERLKEELRNGKTLRVSLDEGRRRAFPSILYSNLATILTALILFNFGTGTVKGFALTLIVGVVVSFFTAVFVTQLLLHGAIEYQALRRRRL